MTWIATYEKTDVVHGSNALITGLGNPSGTVYYVRKRPTNEFEGNFEANRRRVFIFDVDIVWPSLNVKITSRPAPVPRA